MAQAVAPEYITPTSHTLFCNPSTIEHTSCPTGVDFQQLIGEHPSIQAEVIVMI
jgi:hypothetical protein